MKHPLGHRTAMSAFALVLATAVILPAQTFAAESFSIDELPGRTGSFKVADIQLQGLQRVSSGTVFNLLPVNVGDTVDAAEIRELTRALFKSGYFDDIQMLRDEGSLGSDAQADNRATLIVRVRERPAIEEIELDGNKAIKTEDLLESLGEAGLREGEIFKQATLERIGIELQRSYFAQGRYDAAIDASVNPAATQPGRRRDRNRRRQGFRGPPDQLRRRKGLQPGGTSGTPGAAAPDVAVLPPRQGQVLAGEDAGRSRDAGGVLPEPRIRGVQRPARSRSASPRTSARCTSP